MIYDVSGNSISNIYAVDGTSLSVAYDVNGNSLYGRPQIDYSNYSYTQKWASKGISDTQGFDIYDGKVFWISKSGDSTISANCYVFNLSDGSQALSSQPITVYSGHGNNISFSFPKMYASPAYPPSRVYVNNVSNDFLTFTLDKTLTFDDGTADLDCCIDEDDSTIMWTLGHISGTATRWIISKWDLTQLTDNGDDTYTPYLIWKGKTSQPESNRYFQGIRYHDGILWYNSGYGTETAYTYGVNPTTGAVLYSINHGITTEPEGLSWVADADAVGGYALYVGFQGMMLRKYTFAELS